ncbi:MAG: hypothetical protein AB7S69_13835 [Salinivirgaceae bacterium]
MNQAHTFHIPVMGIGYTIDTPLKVAPLGIDSVISLVDDQLIERMRQFYCEAHQIEYQKITTKVHDYRAKRITAYLNLLNDLINEKTNALKNITEETRYLVNDYFKLLPDSSALKQEYVKISAENISLSDLRLWLQKNIKTGSIDVNIMTKVDRANYIGNEQLPTEFNDGHAALRGYALSNLNSSLILSAGMNPRLYGFMDRFEDFYPDADGNIKKKIVLKVSDYRSALIQGKFLAKKGMWVSEYRIESGLNCGGHAFATDGFLMGPILKEFRDNRTELATSVYELLQQALVEKGKTIPNKALNLKITAQGGVGTPEEHLFLMDEYQVDSVGWGTPFLLVPEVVAIDNETVKRLEEAREDDLYLSYISPLGVAFNNLRGNTKDAEKLQHIADGKPGSACPKKYVALNGEFTEKPICSASRQYQKMKIEQLKQAGLSDKEYKKQYTRVIEKACICVGLGTSSLLAKNLDTKIEGTGVSVCPGPNMAYFSKKMTLVEMVDHIYGRQNVITRTDRPNLFIKELNIYIDFLKNSLSEADYPLSKKEEKHFLTFFENLNLGIDYYQQLFKTMRGFFEQSKVQIENDLQLSRKKLEKMMLTLKNSAAVTPAKVLS